jgi:hypothetical protein
LALALAAHFAAKEASAPLLCNQLTRPGIIATLKDMRRPRVSGREPQRLATWILRRCTPAFRRDSFIGDLMEQYEERGGCWYWRQALGAVRARSTDLLVSATEAEVPAAEYVGDLFMSILLGMCGLTQLLLYVVLVITLIRSGFSIVVVSVLVGTASIGAATRAHEIRMRTPGAN